MPSILIYAPLDYKEVSHFMEMWRKLAVQNGLKGIYFVGQGNMVHRKAILALGFNAFNDAAVLVFKRIKMTYIWLLEKL